MHVEECGIERCDDDAKLSYGVARISSLEEETAGSGIMGPVCSFLVGLRCI